MNACCPAHDAPAPPVRVSLPVHLAVGNRVYHLGTVAGSDSDELMAELADRAEELAVLLRSDATVTAAQR